MSSTTKRFIHFIIKTFFIIANFLFNRYIENEDDYEKVSKYSKIEDISPNSNTNEVNHEKHAKKNNKPLTVIVLSDSDTESNSDVEFLYEINNK